VEDDDEDEDEDAASDAAASDDDAAAADDDDDAKVVAEEEVQDGASETALFDEWVDDAGELRSGSDVDASIETSPGDEKASAGTEAGLRRPTVGKRCRRFLFVVSGASSSSTWGSSDLRWRCFVFSVLSMSFFCFFCFFCVLSLSVLSLAVASPTSVLRL